MVYAATATYDHAQVTDTQSTLAAAWGLGTTGGVGLPPVWQDLAWRSLTADGTVVSNRLPGATIWGALFYWVLPVPTDVARVHDLPVWPAAIASATVVAIAMAIFFLALDRLVDDRRVALGGALVFALGTPTWSVSADALWTHGQTQLGIAIALFALARDRWWLAGAGFAWAIFARPQVAVAAAVVGIGMTIVRRDWRPVVQVGAASAPGLLGVALWTRMLFDSWLPVAGYQDTTTSLVTSRLTGTGGSGWHLPPFLAGVPKVFLHPLRGVLLYTPWILVCLPGLRAGWRVAPWWVRLAALGGVAELILQLSVQPSWHGGDDHFGYRIALEFVMLSAPLLLLSWREGVAGSRLGTPITVVFVAASVVLYALGSTVFDPRHQKRAEYAQYVAELGPNGEGYNTGTAVGPDLTAR